MSNVRGIFKTYLGSHPTASVASVARAIDVNQSRLNQYVNDKYDVSQEAISQLEEKIMIFLAAETDRANSINQLPFVKTQNAVQALNILEFCRTFKLMGLIYGTPGTSKTVTANHFAEKYPDVIMITAGVGWGVSSVLRTICRAINVPETGPVDIVTRLLIDELADRGVTLVIDEAQMLPVKCLEKIKELHDLGKIGIIYLAQSYLLRKMIGKDRELYAQLHQRILAHRELKSHIKEDIKLICNSVGIDDDEVITAVFKVANGRGRSSRSAGSVLRMALLDQRNSGNPVTPQTIQNAETYIL